MVKRLVYVAMLLMVYACVQHALASGGLMPVTKETQAKLGLNYTLVAERIDKEAVLVRMEIPRDGKLKNLRSVGMWIGTGSQPEMAATLATTPGKNGSWSVAFQVSPEFANKCSVQLVVPDNPNGGMEYTVYSVQLKGYITDRK